MGTKTNQTSAGHEGGIEPLASGVSTDGEGHVVNLAPDAEVAARIEIRGRNNRFVLGSGAGVQRYAPAGFGATVPDLGRRSDASILIEGDDNHVEVAQGTRLAMNMVVRGDGNRIRIDRDCHLHGFVNLITDNGVLTVGAGTTMVQGSIQLHEPLTITIGADCMISSQVYVSASDIHPIHDRATGERINPGRPIEIGDHVWLGLRSMVLKGARIGTGAIAAAGSIVSGQIPPHAVAAGAPARVMRRNVEWRRDFDDMAAVVAPVETPRRRWRPFGK